MLAAGWLLRMAGPNKFFDELTRIHASMLDLCRVCLNNTSTAQLLELLFLCGHRKACLLHLLLSCCASVIFKLQLFAQAL